MLHSSWTRISVGSQQPLDASDAVVSTEGCSRCVKWHNFSTLGLYCKNIPITKPPLFGHYVNVCGPRPIPNTCGQRARSAIAAWRDPKRPWRWAMHHFVRLVFALRNEERGSQREQHTYYFQCYKKQCAKNCDFIGFVMNCRVNCIWWDFQIAGAKKCTFCIRKRSDQITTTAFNRRPDKN